MNIIDYAIIGGIAYLGYRISQEKQPLPPLQELDGTETPATMSGQSGVAPTMDNAKYSAHTHLLSKTSEPNEIYPLDSTFFESLEYNTQNNLIRGFAEDYTAPRMLNSDSDYKKALIAANHTGAPIAWTQYIVSRNPKLDTRVAAIRALQISDEYTRSGGNNLNEMRNLALSGCMSCM